MQLNCKEFYFARHGETDNNVQGLVTGSVDMPLNQNGINQAQLAADFVKGLPISRTVCSRLDRAYKTATLMLAQTAIQPILTDGLEERNWGRLENTPKDNLDRYSFTEMGVELWDEYIERTRATLAKLDFSTPLFIVAHSGTFRALCDCLNIKIEKRPVRNAWPYRFYQEDDEWFVEEC
ncbi:MAG: histidine phosphatase family protein [Deferribacteraceae bacterium]|jgi:probable phosphoglycerate mutase|nr:histidine phosphatase family protein [Deferribacteraceae bacterium]